ncbi:MAG: terminase small subunit [Deltaproteobacteria bacterium]|nr:terminase small subunit [Deltaproteobacteria bacterium]
MTRKLTARQQRFVAEYIKNPNATQAALKAGYKDGSIGRHLVTKKHVSEAIAERQEKLQKELEISQERTLNEIAAAAFLDIGEIFDEAGNLLHVDQIPEEARRAIASIETEKITRGRGDDATPVTIRKIRFHDKLKALEQLAKHLGLFVEKHEHSGPNGGPIETKITDFPPIPKTIQEWVEQREEAEKARKALEAPQEEK